MSFLAPVSPSLLAFPGTREPTTSPTGAPAKRGPANSFTGGSRSAAHTPPGPIEQIVHRGGSESLTQLGRTEAPVPALSQTWQVAAILLALGPSQ